MQLKQKYSKYSGQIDEEMKGTFTKDPESEKTHQEEDVLTLRKLLNKNTKETKSQTTRPT